MYISSVPQKGIISRIDIFYNQAVCKYVTCADIINQKSKTFNSLFISVLNAPVPPLSNDVCLKALA